MTADLAARLYRASHLTGSFVLRSGTTATEYFDKFQFTADPLLLKEVAAGMAELIPPDVDLLAGLELGGIPLAAALALRTGTPAVYVRKARKTYGTQKVAEGPEVAGRRLVVVDDVLTTGGAILDATRDLRADGAVVEMAVVVIDRSTDGKENLARAGLDLRSLYSIADLERAAGLGSG